MDSTKQAKSEYLADIESNIRALQALRCDNNELIDMSYEQFVNKRYGVTMESYMADLGINTGMDTISNLAVSADVNVRWLIPEIFSSAIRLGLRKNPLWPEIIAAEQKVKNPTVNVPHFEMSEAAPRYVGEAETIPIGNVAIGQKSFSINKIGRGIKVTYELLQYVVIDLVAIFLQDFGVKLNQAIDTLMITTLINGEQSSGSESAPVVGITTISTLTYTDLLRVWVRLSRLGKNPTAIIGGEAAALLTLNLTEFKQPYAGSPIAKLDVKTPLPTTTNYFIHGAMPANQQMIIDRGAAIIKYNAQPLLLEAEKIVSNQTEATYASLTTGFGILFRDARVIVDNSVDFDVDGFPSYMDPTTQEVVTIS